VVELYSEDDRAAGRIRGQDRHGRDREFPLMRCSIGVLELPRGLVIDDVNRVSSEIAELKKKAKSCDTGLVIRPFGELG